MGVRGAEKEKTNNDSICGGGYETMMINWLALLGSLSLGGGNGISLLRRKKGSLY